MNSKPLTAALACALAVLLLAAPAMAAENPCNPCAKNPCNPCAKNPCNPCAKNPCNPCSKASSTAMMPALNRAFASEGTVFYVQDAMKRDSVTFESQAPLEDIVGTTNEIAGYIVFDPEDPRNGVRAEFSVPVASLNTGIPLRDEHLQSGMWLDAANHPMITLTVNDARAKIKKLRSSGDFQTYETELDGQLTLRGKTRDVRISARIVHMVESAKTQTKMPGDLLAARASLEVPLADFGVTGPSGAEIVGTKVSDVISIDVSFTGTTQWTMAGNPCNPCAKNPCNPCSKNPCNPCNKKK